MPQAKDKRLFLLTALAVFVGLLPSLALQGPALARESQPGLLSNWRDTAVLMQGVAGVALLLLGA